MLESGITFDFGQLVMDNEFGGIIKYAVNGSPVNDDTLAVDIIREVGPFNDFLSHDSTFRHMRSQSQPGLIDRRIRARWQDSGGNDLYQKATQKAREILETHKPEPLPDNVLSTIRTIVEDTEKELGVAENHKKK